MLHAARPTLVLVLAAASAFAGCGGTNLPTQPAASPPPSQVPVDPTPMDPTPVDPTPVGGQPEAPGVVITALNIDFNPKAVTVPANVPLTLMFDNQDAGIPHGVQISDANGNVILKSEITTGPKQLQVALPALAPGAYTFACPVHPNMTGTITAQ